MMRIRTLWFLAAALLAGGCNLAPPFAKPDPKLPASFKTSGIWRTAKPADAGSRGDWWRAFGDSKLDDLMKQAGSANASLEIARHRMEEARALARADTAGLFPVLGSTASAKRNRATGAVSTTPGAGRTITRLRGTLDLGYEVDLWGRVRNNARASEAGAEAVEADYRSALLSLQAELALNYFALQAQDETIALLKRTTELRRKALQLATARFKQGDTAQLDVAQAETELASTESEAIGLEKKRAELEHAIALLIGRTPSEFSLPSMALKNSTPGVPRSVPGDLLERRPDIAAAERRMAEMNAEIGVAKAALFPSIKLGTTIGTESSAVEHLASSAARVWGLGPELQWDVLSAGRNKAKIDAAKARYDEAAASYRDTVLKAVRDVEDALSGIDVLQRQHAAQQQTVTAARRTVELAQKRYDAGLVAFYEVLDAQRTLLRAEQDETAVSGELFLSTVMLIKALGGAW